uniref:HMA domain-containing protein n=1 Tax=Arundo donax TaxID=35708 RepID=A0A0A9GC10_ARUDO
MVTGTMDVPAMVSYLQEKINRPVEAVAPGKKDGGGEGKHSKKDKGGDGDKNKDAAVGGDDKKDKGKSIDVAGPSTAAAAAFMAPAPAVASTYHVTPPYGYVEYPQQGPAPGSYYHPYPYYGNADGMGHANPSAATYYHQQQQPYADATQHQGYPPYPYRLDMAPAPQLFSDENPNACSVM